MNEANKIYYRQRAEQLQQTLNKLYKKRKLLGILRFIIIAITAVIVYKLWFLQFWWIIAIIITGTAVFLLAISIDADNKSEIEHLELLLFINKNEIEIAKGNFLNEYDGKNLEPEQHAYATDLDIFGKASLYQYINRCNADKAKALLASRLLNALSKEEILNEREAVKELAQKMNGASSCRLLELNKKYQQIQK